MSDAGELLKLAEQFERAGNVQMTIRSEDGLRISGFPLDSTKDNTNAKLIAGLLRQAASQGSAGASQPAVQSEEASKWPEIDRELSAYVQTIRADLIEQCAKIAESEPATHAERCIAAPYAVRSNAADRIRALANSREPASIAQAPINRGRHYDIAEALESYDEWINNDDYNTTALDKIMKRMRERLETTDAPAAISQSKGTADEN